jgi:hypothetical protein
VAYTASFNDGTLSSVVVLEAAWRALASGLMHGLWLMRLPSVMEHHRHQLRWKRRDELLLMDWCMLIGERQWGSDNFFLLLLSFFVFLFLFIESRMGLPTFKGVVSFFSYIKFDFYFLLVILILDSFLFFFNFIFKYWVD